MLWRTAGLMKTFVPMACRALSLATIVALAGCGTPTSLEPDYTASGFIRLPANLGSVGLVVVRPDAGFLLDGPHHRLEAAKLEARDGAKAAAGSELALLFPATYVLGGVYGVLAGISEGELQGATRSCTAVCRDVDFDGKVAQAVRQKINAAYPGQWRDLEDDLPVYPGRTQGHVGRGSGMTNGRSLNLASIPRPNVQTVIRVRIVFRGFQVYEDPEPALGSDSIFHLLRQKHNPPLRMVMIIDVTALRVSDLMPIGEMLVSYSSQPRSFLEWAANDARPFRQEMEAGLKLIQHQLGKRLDFGLQAKS